MATVTVDKVRIYRPQHGPDELAVHIGGEDFVKACPAGSGHAGAAFDFARRIGVPEVQFAEMVKGTDGRTRLVETTVPVA